ncbi:MAG: hypothetical protein CEN89_30 [Candidatus Berkelbacteria bacterium Licking1014_7]|uniref:Uncharacterized protein n=1 Tax=Candidatus Berkelbacteria bacterium Licking1014_7 TaxID=2017147 RepID=A0A554LKV3_9BACT|nr:MAG: hypothetical protein CEN89_30 [Candidatus Berkelbacteria bacterium Licking1014_7]
MENKEALCHTGYYTPEVICEALGINLGDYEKISEVHKKNLQHYLRMAICLLEIDIGLITDDQKKSLQSIKSIQECLAV